MVQIVDGSETPVKGGVLVRRQSTYTGRWSEQVLPCTMQQFATWRNGALIQDAFPALTSEQREFVLTGLTPQEWAELFGDEE